MMPLTTRQNLSYMRDIRREFWITEVARGEMLAHLSTFGPIDAPERIAAGSMLRCYHDNVGDYTAMCSVHRDV